MTDPITRLNTALEGRYRIERQLGEGGMATVYLARDLKHNRNVALKVLKPELAAVVGADRFLAEIETTANLQHPHILPLFDSGEADSFLFYVMPYVEGESLRERLDREHQLPVDEAVRIATNVAEALDYAHSHGVIHRDIKPANILLQAGKPVISDFGIALALGAAGGGRLTETGLSLGTPHYMSPEQATGDLSIGAATDVYALGCVLFEMLVGEPPYTGSTPQAILGKIIQAEPVSASKTRRTVPANVDAAIRRSLEKVPADRFAGASEFARALGSREYRHGEAMGSDAAGSASRSPALATTLGIFALISSVLAAWGWLRPAGRAALASYDLGVPDSVPLMTSVGSRAFTVSPDGDFLVYIAQRGSGTELWYRSLTSGETHPIGGTLGVSRTPVITNGGNDVAFVVGSELKIVSIDGGTARTLTQGPEIEFALDESDDLAYVDFDDAGNRYKRLDPTSGEIEEERYADYCVNPQTLPDGGRLLCGGGGVKSAYTVDLREGAGTDSSFLKPLSGTGASGASRETAGIRGSDFRIVDDQYVVYVSLAGDLRAAPIDLVNDRIGRSVVAMPGVRAESLSGSGQFQVTSDGTLYYVPGVHAQIVQPVRADAEGEVLRLGIEPAAFLRYDMSPDGRRFAAVVEGVDGQELRIYDVDTGQYRVWTQSVWVGFPRWSPGGDRLLIDVGGFPGSPVAVLLGSPTSASPPDTVARLGQAWASDYRADSLILVWTGPGESRLDLRSTPPTVESVGPPAVFGSLSPDGRWLVHAPRAANTLVIEPWPARDRIHTVAGLGSYAEWGAAGELVSRDRNGRWFKTRVDAASDPPLDEPELWFEDQLATIAPGRSFARTPDGGVLYMQRLGPNVAHFIRVVPGWVERMKRAVDEANR
jgi:hypothetical protein